MHLICSWWETNSIKNLKFEYRIQRELKQQNGGCSLAVMSPVQHKNRNVFWLYINIKYEQLETQYFITNFKKIIIETLNFVAVKKQANKKSQACIRLLLVVNRSCPVKWYIICLEVMLSAKVPQKVINSNCQNLLQSDTLWISLQQSIDFLH